MEVDQRCLLTLIGHIFRKKIKDEYGCTDTDFVEIEDKPISECPIDTMPVIPERPVIRHYATLDYMDNITKSDTSIRNQKYGGEQQIRRSVKHSERGQYSIPIRLHVLYADSSQRVSEELIHSQIAQINSDFSTAAYTKKELHLNSTFADTIYNEPSMSINFCLDPEGINYHQLEEQSWTDYNSMKLPGSGVESIEPDSYLNIWICSLPDSITGYAQMPWGPSSTDGIVIDHRYIGPIDKRIEDPGNELTGLSAIEQIRSRYSGGHTLTHLVGNYLGLYPLWGAYRCGDDYVKDTPVHHSPSFYCLDEGQKMRSACDPNLPSLYNNFMDNTPDACLDSFTKGQMARMMAVLTQKGYRNQLTTCIN